MPRLGKKRKLNMKEPVESVSIRAQQSFDVDGGLNPVKFQLEDNKSINLLKKKT